jgi:hypothetical protein
MTTITVHHLSLQFDTHDALPDTASISRKTTIVTRALNEFSDALKLAFPESQPQITFDSEDFDLERDITADPL